MTKLTPSRLEKLYNNENLSQREIAERFDLSQSCISKKMKNWGIDSDHEGFWTEDEISLIESLYPEDTERLKSEIDRSWNAIKLKAMELGLARDQEEYRKSEEVKNRLKELAAENRIEVELEGHEISYILGVVDGDGYHDCKGTIGLEVKNPEFAHKFAEALRSIGLNPETGDRRGKITVWASSKILVEWLQDLDYTSRLDWLIEKGDSWKYIEGAYDSDGNLSLPSPRICSYDRREKEFLKSLLEYLDLNPRVHSNSVYIPVADRQKFFENIDSVYERRSP